MLLEAREKHNFRYQDGYDGIASDDLLTLLRITQETTWSLEEELSRRRDPDFIISDKVKSCIGKLLSGIDTLHVTQRLDDTSKQVSAAVKALKGDSTEPKTTTYRQFLEDVRKQCSPGAVMLCAWAIGKGRIVGLKKQERIKLLRYLEQHIDLFTHPILDEVATSSRIGTTAGGPLGTASTVHPLPVERRKPLFLFLFQSPPNIHAEIEYKYSEADVDMLSLLGHDLFSALKTSKQWKWELQTGHLHKTTDCITGLIPRTRGDIALHLLLGFEEGSKIIEGLRMAAI